MATEKKVTFDTNAGPLSVVMKCGQANTGNYNLRVFEKDFIKVIERFPITEFGTEPANTHVIAGAASSHNGRFIRSFSSVGLLGNPKAFSVSMEISQGGKRIGEVNEGGTGSDLTMEVELIAELVAVSAGAAMGVPTGAPRIRRSARRKARGVTADDAKVVASTKALLDLPKTNSRKPAKPKPKAKKKAKTKTKPRKSPRRKKGGLKK